MSREELVQKYQQLYEAAEEKSLEWYSYGEGFALLEDCADLAWVLDQLEQRIAQWQERAVNAGYINDGAYREWCYARARLLSEIKTEITNLSEQEAA
jgi:hypothetical protein